MPIQRWTIGKVTITRIEEMQGALFDAKQFFPDFDAAVFQAHAGWLCPHHVDGSGGMQNSIHSWVIQSPQHTILVDGCVGDGKPRLPFKDWHEMDSGWLERLKRAGFAPEDIDMVMCTHLHVDHVGWNTRQENGAWVPTFPNARYLFSEQEYAHAKAEREKESVAAFERVSDQVFDDSIAPLVEAGVADLIKDQHEACDGLLRLHLAPGHTPGSVVIDLSESRGALFTGDVFHHPVQLARPDWNSAFCADADQARATREQVLSQLAGSDRVLMPAHFAAPYAGTVERRDIHCRFIPLQPDEVI